MLIWINGAFGVGKTQTAHELHRRLTASHVADPELLGFAMHKMLPPARHDDFHLTWLIIPGLAVRMPVELG